MLIFSRSGFKYHRQITCQFDSAEDCACSVGLDDEKTPDSMRVKVALHHYDVSAIEDHALHVI